MPMNLYCLYSHTNKINNKKYIGITCQEPEKRWGLNGRNYYDSPKFWNAILKYGWDNFNHEILLKNLTQEEARKLEIEYIAKYNTISSGYNISAGGDVPPIFYGKNNHNFGGLSEETKIKMSKNHADFSKGKHPRAKSVMCIELNKIFNTITEAAEEFHVSRSCIRDACKGIQKISAGCHWKYLDSDL